LSAVSRERIRKEHAQRGPHKLARAFSRVPITIRQLEPSDADALNSHLLHLDKAARHMRFRGMSDGAVSNHAAHCLACATVYGAFDDDHLCAVAELFDSEVAFSVDGAYRQQGLGKRLFARVLEAARAAHLAAVKMDVLPENTAMRRLARAFGTNFTFEPGMLSGTCNVA